MRSLIIVLVTIIFVCGTSYSQEIKTLDFNDMKPILHKDNDSVYVINFWATWCGPCIKELPYFEELNKSHSEEKVKVVLVSLDFPGQYESSLLPFLKRKNIKSDVIFLDDGKAHIWIPKVDNTWSGAIPATLIYKGNSRWFHEGSLTRDELFNKVKKFTN